MVKTAGSEGASGSRFTSPSDHTPAQTSPLLLSPRYGFSVEEDARPSHSRKFAIDETSQALHHWGDTRADTETNHSHKHGCKRSIPAARGLSRRHHPVHYRPMRNHTTMGLGLPHWIPASKYGVAVTFPVLEASCHDPQERAEALANSPSRGSRQKSLACIPCVQGSGPPPIQLGSGSFG